MKRSLTLLPAAALGLVALDAVALEPKTTNPSCQDAYAVLGWSKFDVQESEAVEKLAATRLKKGAVLEQMGDPCAAAVAYQGVVALADRGAAPDKVSEARAHLASLESTLRSTVTVKADPDKATGLVVTVDGARASGTRLTLGPGNHTIEVAATGFDAHSETITVCKEERDLLVTLQAPSAAPSSEAPKASAAPAGDKDGDDDDDDDGEKGDDDKAPKGEVKSSGAEATPAAAASPAPAATTEPPKPLVFKGTAAMRRELAKLRIAENGLQKSADHWALSKKLPWNKVGWILGRHRSLERVESVAHGDAHHVSFKQYKVRGQDGAYAYVANCGLGATCNEIAKKFLFMYEGVGVPAVECGALPEILESPASPEIPLPTAEEIKQRDLEWAAAHAKDDDDDDKADKGDKKDGDTSDDDDDDDDD